MLQSLRQGFDSTCNMFKVLCAVCVVCRCVRRVGIYVSSAGAAAAAAGRVARRLVAGARRRVHRVAALLRIPVSASASASAAVTRSAYQLALVKRRWRRR